MIGNSYKKYSSSIPIDACVPGVINVQFVLDSSRSDTAKAVEILRKYLRPFEAIKKEMFTEMCRLLSLDDLRFCQQK